MKKQIILSDRGYCSMSYEEVLDQFHEMLHKFANQAIDKIVFNKPEKEDVMQELKVQTWNAYNRYDVSTGNNFSTYLYYYLQAGTHRSTSKLYAKKRTNENGSISLNQAIGGSDGDEANLEMFLGQEDMEVESLAFREFVSYLEKRLDETEKKILSVLMDKGNYSVQDLADDLGMSRQGANKKVNKFKEKVGNLMKSTGFVSC